MPDVPFDLPEDRNPGGFAAAQRMGLRPEGARVAAQFPDYLRYCRVVHPKDYVVALAMGPKHGGMKALLVGLGYPEALLPPDAEAPQTEDIRPKAPNW
jgi:hypothetical protein